MGSYLKNLVRGIEETIMEKEKMEGYEEVAEAMEKQKISITSRFDSMQTAYIDMLAKKCDLSRSAMVHELSTSALMDVMEEMGVTEEFFDKLSEHAKKEAPTDV